MKIFVILAMIFCHILDDFVLQAAWLTYGKQKSWWEKNAPEPMYKHDYIVALIMHATSWSFLMMLPIMVYYHFELDWYFIVVFVENVVLHAVTDHLKANKHLINLVADQTCHFLQIAITAVVLLFWR